MQTPNHSQDNITQIRVLFPNCVTETRDNKGIIKYSVDFDLLRQEISESIVEGPQERYHLNWPGKREALITANAPIAKTLRPCQEESVAFDTTKNLFIEGDNLEALKLLQETYLGKIKMIYIDPPYNTGNDFIYEDDFAENTDEFLKKSNQKDESGNRLVANTESNGRFHSDWLSMMYPRLRLARNLLKDDGVIFISIDDGEVHNLRKICDEVFGEVNFVANVVWEKKYSPSNDAKWLSDNHDHILVYVKHKESWRPKLLPRSDEHNNRYTNKDNDSRGPWKSSDLSVKSYSEKYDYPITTPSGRVVNPPHGTCWRVSSERFTELKDDNRIWFGINNDNVPSLKRFLHEVQDGIVPLTIWKYSEVGHNQIGRQEVKELFDGMGLFDSPKPVSLLSRILHVANLSADDIILDFFAGSSTTAHAVMQLNAEDGGNRKFIMVQLPEACDEKSEAFKAGYPNIAEISKERIRRAGKKIIEGDCHESWEKDIGFRVFKVDSSNMSDVYHIPDAIRQDELDFLISNIKPDRAPEDLLFQVLLDWGVDLTLPIRKEILLGKSVFFVDENALVACFDDTIGEELIKELAKRKPLRVVFRDLGFTSDAAKINAGQSIKQISPDTKVKVI